MLDKRRDPVDLMLEGKLAEATKRYLELYVESLEEGDRSVGADIVIQLHYCVAGQSEMITDKKHGRPPEDLAQEVEEVIFRELARRELHFDKSVIADDIAIATEGLRWQKKRAEKSIEAVEHEQERR